MAQISISHIASQVGLSVDEVLSQLANAGVPGKSEEDALNDDEKQRWHEFIRATRAKAGVGRREITITRSTQGEIKQTSRTGATRTVRVETRRARQFVRREVVEARHVAEAVQRKTDEEERVARLDEAEAEVKAKARVEAEVEGGAVAETSTVEGVGVPAVVSTGVSTKVPEVVEVPTEVSTVVSELVEVSEVSEVSSEVVEVSAEVTEVSAEVTEVTEVKEVKEEEVAKAGKKGKKGKGKGDGGRAELHVTKGRGGRSRRKALRVPGKIAKPTATTHEFAKPTAPVVHAVNIPETISVAELAQAMSVKAGEVIKVMMAMGSMVTINQLLDQDTATVVVEEMGHVAKPVATDDPEVQLLARDDSSEVVKPRPPVVTVMGHVDHGKTTLLDYLRDSKVAAGEAGGITQHIGAYKVQLPQGEICFLDTPGHEAFSAMRARGARATDLIILVVAADDGVKPQTIEAINHARVADVPLIVAINKMDREDADAEKVRQELAQHAVVAEGWGGEVLMNEVSAVSGEGVEGLLESVLLQAELLDLQARDSGPAVGQVVEARIDKGRGPVATVLVQQGCLRRGDIVLAGRESGRVRVLTDYQGRTVEGAGPSTPVEIQGLAGVPVAGDDVVVVSDERKAREVALHRQGKYKEVKLARQQHGNLESMIDRMGEGEAQVLNLLIKADVQGSVEALTESLEKMSVEAVRVKVVHGMAGGITESDVNLAVTAGAMIIGFNVRADASARRVLENEGIEVHYYSIIYDVVELVKAAMTGMLKPTVKENQVGLAEVREVFKAPKIGLIAGCYVTEGTVKRNLPVRVLRDNVVIFKGALDSLRRFKDDVAEVKSGFECGIGVKNYNDVKVGDHIEVFELVETASEL